MAYKIISYNPKLVKRARELRNNSTFTEILLWNFLKGKQLLGYDFDRQKSLDNFTVDFYCKELMLAIELDGESHVFRKDIDDKRDQRLKNLGVTVLRFEDLIVIYDTESVLKEIEDWIKNNYK